MTTKVEATPYNESIRHVPMPPRIKALPVSPTGYPVPWFVAWIDGLPDFRVIASGKVSQAHLKRRCWVCGEPMGRYKAMTLGPMCVVNRTVSEPPSHRDCAVFSAIACPFLSKPRMRRREAGLPETAQDMPGIALKRNPGACAVWVTERYWPFRAGDGVLFSFDDPVEVLWFAHGRAATRDEVQASIDGGLPLLEANARTGGERAMKVLRRATATAMKYLPIAAVAAPEEPGEPMP